MLGFLANVFRQIRLPERQRIQHSVACDATGITVQTRTSRKVEAAAIAWADVNSIVAFKQDCFTHDQICLMIASGEKVMLIAEDFEGWGLLIDHLPEYLPGCLSKGEWLLQVMFPAFETNKTVLFTKQG